MSSAIKRLSTIIRPSSAPSSPPKDNGKDTIDAPAPAAPVLDNPSDTPAPADPAAPTANGNGTTAAPADMKETITAGAPADDTAPAEPVKDKDAAPADVKKDKDAKASLPHRRDARDIGRSTIRRFSTILRSQGRDGSKDPAAPASDEAKPAEDSPQPEDAPKKDETSPAPAEPAADQPTMASAPDAAGKDPVKTSKRRPSGFFTAAREGLQRTAKDVQTRARPSRPAKDKAAPKPEVVTVPKIVKKGAARGKRVVVVTGASKGVGLEFVRQFATQPNTFVIALSRTADKSPALKPVVAASAKEGHNVRALKLDVTSTRSTNSVVKDIVELTDGRVDLLINAAGSRGNPVLKVWDLKGSELEDELRNNLIGPIAFTNALLPYLKPMPPKEEKKEEKAEEKEKDKEVKAEEKADAKDDKTDAKAEKLEVKAEKLEAKAEKLEAKAEQLEAKPEVKAEKAEQLEVKAEKLEAKAEKLEAKAEKLEAPKPDVLVPAAKPAEGPAATAGVSESHPPPAVEPVSAKPSPEAAKSTEPAAEPTALAEPEPAPTFLPAQPFIVFLTPADPIQNVGGTVPTGSVFAPAPRTLFSLSRAPLQVAIAKYAVGLSGRGVGVVGVERHGQHDPHAEVSDEQAAAAVVGLLPGLSVKDNGKLLRVA